MTGNHLRVQHAAGEPALIEVTGGVDTHKDTHTAAAIDSAGRLLGCEQFDTSASGLKQLLTWLQSFGTLCLVGIEGTGSYGAGLARHLKAHCVPMVEVDRPDRKSRRFRGKSDPIDAESAARAALSGRQTGLPKDRDGRVEALRALRVARTAAVANRADLQRRIRGLIVTAPQQLRSTLSELTLARLIRVCAAAEPSLSAALDPTIATQIALRSMARSHAELTIVIRDLDKLIAPLIADINAKLLQLPGVGPEVAGQLIITAGENIERVHSEAAFAMLCGVAPIPASSGKTRRHRLNRGGDRDANSALWRIVVTRMKNHPPTMAYIARRTAEGMNKREIIRCLKRYVAREVFNILSPSPPKPATLAA